MRSVSMLAGAAVVAAALAYPVLATTQPGPLLVTVTTSPNPYAIRGQTSVAKSQGIIGFATGTQDVGLEGFVTQPNSAGLEGYANSTSGAAGNGVFGDSQNGNGVLGVGTGSGFAGVYGSDASAGGIGVVGSGAGGVSGTTTAVSGTGAQTEAGVLGTDGSATGDQVGVIGASANIGTGVLGELGSAKSDFGFYGENAVYGIDTTTDGNGSAITAQSNSGDAILANSSGYATILATAGSNTLPLVLVGPNGHVLSVDSSGNLIAAGTLTASGTPQSLVRDDAGRERVIYGPQAAQPTAEDDGRATMTNGVADVALSPDFASILASNDYLVFVTPRGPYPVYVASQSARGFEVRAIGAKPSMTFDYRIVGSPRTDRARPRLAFFKRPPDVTVLHARRALHGVPPIARPRPFVLPAYAMRRP